MSISITQSIFTLKHLRLSSAPIPEEHEWILPAVCPSYHKKAKKLRKRVVDEPRNPYKVSRANMVVRCGKCNQIGHNTRSWKTESHV